MHGCWKCCLKHWYLVSPKIWLLENIFTVISDNGTPRVWRRNFTRLASVAIFHMALWFVVTVWGVLMFFAVILDTFSEIRNKTGNNTFVTEKMGTSFSRDSRLCNFLFPLSVNYWFVSSSLSHRYRECRWLGQDVFAFSWLEESGWVGRGGGRSRPGKRA